MPDLDPVTETVTFESIISSMFNSSTMILFNSINDIRVHIPFADRPRSGNFDVISGRLLLALCPEFRQFQLIYQIIVIPDTIEVAFQKSVQPKFESNIEWSQHLCIEYHVSTCHQPQFSSHDVLYVGVYQSLYLSMNEMMSCQCLLTNYLVCQSSV